MDLYVERAGTGRPFVWAHGLTSSIAAERDTGIFRWEDVPGIDVIRYDARGHGRSPAGASPEDHQWSRLADDLVAVADACSAESFVAGGASMGCATALYAALREPARVQSLVLAIAPTAWETRATQTEAYLKSVGYLEANGLDAFLEASRKLPPQPAWTAANREVRYRHLAGADPAALALALRGAAQSNLPPRDEVATIGVPALLLAWDGDPGHPLSTAESLHELLGASELLVARSPDDVAAWPQAVAEFLRPA
ncbi:MAG TPA: alpha/beta fold hydrolase [Acidimicrobiales bacterium]|nr:alpha/beta fold hydrolase [Acidimicrobiales bacterium]